MFFILSKILLFLLKPLFWILLLLAAALYTSDARKKKIRIIASLSILFLFGNNFLINQVFLSYEDAGNYDSGKTYDVGLVLGGFSKNDTFLKRAVFFEANDRLMQALEGYHTGKFKKLMISSGSAEVFYQSVKEADAVREYLVSIGIHDSDLIIENQSRNTIENIQYSKKILDSMYTSPSVLVYTSAWHIPRTRLCTEGLTGYDFYATNFYGDQRKDYSIMNLLVPSAFALGRSEILIKELVGYSVYMFKSN